jgi:hypothetical protein
MPPSTRLLPTVLASLVAAALFFGVGPTALPAAPAAPDAPAHEPRGMPAFAGLVSGPSELRDGVHGAAAIPYFARRYDLPCAACHVSPPKLNEFGEEFVLRNYRLPDREARSTVPLAVWVSTRADLPGAGPELERSVEAYINRVEFISGGTLAVPWLSYFVEWRPVSYELQGDGTLRDRSGRFEDLFLTAHWDRLEISVGQFRQVEQVDISRRVGVNEPAFFSAGLPGAVEGSPRIHALRSFSLSGRAPTVRAGWTEELGGGWEWTNYLSVSAPGEFSIPLTREARTEASNELSLEAKGVFFESFVRRGLHSWGVHAFHDSSDRYLVGAVGTGRHGPVLWTGALGGAGLDGDFRARASLESEYVWNRFLALGGRVEGREGIAPSFVPYLNTHFPGTRHTFRLTVEHRLHSPRGGTFIELGAIF